MARDTDSGEKSVDRETATSNGFIHDLRHPGPQPLLRVCAGCTPQAGMGWEVYTCSRCDNLSGGLICISLAGHKVPWYG